MKYFKKKLALSGVGLLLGVAIVTTGIGAALLVANFIFGVAAVSLFGVTGAAAFLLSPIGLGIALGVSMLVLLASSIYVHFNKNFVEKLTPLRSESLGGQKISGRSKSKENLYNFSLDAALGIVSGFVFAGAIAAIGAIASLALLSGVGLGFAFVGAAACVLIPVVKLIVQASIIRSSTMAELGLDANLSDLLAQRPRRHLPVFDRHPAFVGGEVSKNRFPHFFSSSEELAVTSSGNEPRFVSNPAQVRLGRF